MGTLDVKLFVVFTKSTCPDFFGAPLRIGPQLSGKILKVSPSNNLNGRSFF